MRSIALHIADDRCMEARLQCALDLARAFGGHLTCMQPFPADNFTTGDLYGDLAANLLPVMRERAEKLRQQVESRLSGEDVAWDWLAADGPARYSLPDEAMLSDAIVMGACDEDGGSENYSALAADVVIHARAPVLLVPEQCRGFDVTAPAAVAWNGSGEACRALRAALPLLHKASEVHLLTVAEPGAEGSGELPPTNGAEYLSRHGIECRITELPAGEGGIGATLDHAARARNASCLVMGAYGHTRLRETLLGGVSRSLMGDPGLPLFLVH